jgi:anti-anti-sigma factor
MSHKNSFEIQPRPDAVVIRFFDQVDANTVELTKHFIQKLVPIDASNLIVDLKHVKFIDSHGIGFFVSLLKRAHKNDGHLFFVAAAGQPASVLEMVGFTSQYVSYAEDVATAEKQIASLL